MVVGEKAHEKATSMPEQLRLLSPNILKDAHADKPRYVRGLMEQCLLASRDSAREWQVQEAEHKYADLLQHR